MDNTVVFNALQTSLSGGIGRYSYELAKNLYENNPHCIKIVIRKEDLNLFEFANKEDLIIATDIKNSKDRNIYEQFKLPKIVYEMYPNAILHYPDSMAPLFSKNKVIITIHDLAFKSLKNVFTWKTKIWKNFMTNLSIKKADKIIAITEFTRKEIIRHYPKIDYKKIQMIHNGFNDFSNSIINNLNIKNEIKDIKKPYILSVSTISPRKNVDGLIKAFYNIKDEIDNNLVVAGNDGWLYEEVHELVNKLNLEDRVLFTGKINDDELKYLYRNANIFAYVSFYEGFGLPPLEAMSYSVPTIVSNTSSIPEVVSDAAIKVDPSDIEAISENLRLLVYNEKLRKELISLGLQQIKKFSWENCALNTKRFYESERE